MLVNDDRSAVLCDFGLAIVLQDEPMGLTTAEGFKGTIRWCSFEVLCGERKSPESDIWSWGLLGYGGTAPAHCLRAPNG